MGTWTAVEGAELGHSNVPGDFAAHRGIAVAATTSASLRPTTITCSGATDRRSALADAGKVTFTGSLQVAGTYTLASFKVASDGDGGTLLGEPR